MYIKSTLSYLEKYLYVFASFLMLPSMISLYDAFTLSTSELNQALAHKSLLLFSSFIQTIIITLSLAWLCHFFAKNRQNQFFFRREAILNSILIWIITPILGSLPYLLSGTLTSITDALFESTSGFTTTGASVLTAIKQLNGVPAPYTHESTAISNLIYTYWGNIPPIMDSNGSIIAEGLSALPRALLFWRSLSQWLGGMGIVALFVAFSPIEGLGSRVLFQSETTGPTKQAMTPRASQTAAILWKIYLGLSLALFLTLQIVCGLPWIDAITLTFSTISTGGFTLYSEGISHYDLPQLEWILIIFMTLGGVNFSLIYLLFKRKWQAIKNEEFWLYIASLLIGSLIITFYLSHHSVQFLNGTTHVLEASHAWRLSLFHFISAQTSTGFASVNYDIWPFAAQSLLLLAMYIGGMSGSTAGGMKIVRHSLLIRYTIFKMRNILYPNEITQMKIAKQNISEPTVHFTFIFFFLVIASTAFSILFFIFQGIEPESALSITACLINNVGFSFRLAGPTESFVFLSPAAKLYSCFLMILGRLEFFTLLVIALPSFWKKV